MLTVSEMHQQFTIPSIDEKAHRIFPEISQSLDQEIEALHQHRYNPYKIFAAMLFPALSSANAKSARMQTYVDEARVACALERYRLTSGQFPETLEALVPKFMEKLPHDVINGQPLKYRRTDDGQFVLYSVGWNKTDDGGKVELTKSGNPDWQKGDWIWRYPAQGDATLPRSK